MRSWRSTERRPRAMRPRSPCRRLRVRLHRRGAIVRRDRSVAAAVVDAVVPAVAHLRKVGTTKSCIRKRT
jgi:hypothetical protein